MKAEAIKTPVLKYIRHGIVEKSPFDLAKERRLKAYEKIAKDNQDC